MKKETKYIIYNSIVFTLFILAGIFKLLDFNKPALIFLLLGVGLIWDVPNFKDAK